MYILVSYPHPRTPIQIHFERNHPFANMSPRAPAPAKTTTTNLNTPSITAVITRSGSEVAVIRRPHDVANGSLICTTPYSSNASSARRRIEPRQLVGGEGGQPILCYAWKKYLNPTSRYTLGDVGRVMLSVRSIS